MLKLLNLLQLFLTVSADGIVSTDEAVSTDETNSVGQTVWVA